MNKESKTRIISGLIMITVLIALIAAGQIAVFITILLVGALVFDELVCNFFKKSRLRPTYLVGHILFLVPMIFAIVIGSSEFLKAAVMLAVLFNLFLLYYLFFLPIPPGYFEYHKAWSWLSAPLVLMQSLSLILILHFEHWRSLLVILIIITTATDIGAWVIGINFGKRKMWPKISPKKTVEGSIGGIFFCVVFAMISWWLLEGTPSLFMIPFFIFFSVISQVGDLVQSKIKRNFQIKDSSKIIPGHGGVYDRVDSLLFSAPFFAFFWPILKDFLQ